MLLPNDPVDWLIFLQRSLLLLVVLLCCLLGMFFADRFKFVVSSRVLRIALLSLAFILVATIVRRASGREMLVVLLGSEDDQIAEKAYDRLQKEIQTEWLIEHINSKTEGDNVRFYLSRMLGSDLSKSNLLSKVLPSLSQDSLEPRFIGTNNFNQDIKFISIPLTPRSIVQYYGSSGNRVDEIIY